MVPLAVGSGIWICPHGDFDASTWGLLCIFAATISGLISRPLPMGAIVVISITTLGVLGILTTKQVLSGFSNSTVWLVVAAFIFAKGFKDTRLGERIAYHIIAAFGKSSLRLGYSLVLADLVGASPANLVTGLLKEYRAAMVTGINLAMLIRVWNYRDTPLESLTHKAVQGGIRGIEAFHPPIE